MKVSLEKTFPLPASADIVWPLLQDIEQVATCMPGARITERIDATHYKGTVAVKFGPASMAFRGEIEVAALDAETKTLRLIGKGTDNTGGSGASMDLTARIEAVGAAACNLHGISDVSMSGKAAAFGGRMMGSVSDQILRQFAANLANKVQALQAAAPSAAAKAAVKAAAPESPMAVGSGRAPELPVAHLAATAAQDGASPAQSGPGAQHASGPSVAPALHPAPIGQPAASIGQAAAPAVSVDAAPAGSTSDPAAESAHAAAPSAYVAQPPAELNGFALIWAVFKDWLRSLFGAKRA